jgi:hypothetical protein
MANKKDAPAKFLSKINSLADGLEAVPPAGQDTLVMGGKPYDRKTLIADLRAFAATYQAVEDAEAVHTLAVAERGKIADDAHALYGNVRDTIKTLIGKKNPDLAKYDLVPAKTPRELTLSEKEARAAKALATRKARHTMGKRQKAGVKGS